MAPGFSFSVTLRSSDWPGHSLGRQIHGSVHVSVEEGGDTGVVGVAFASGVAWPVWGNRRARVGAPIAPTASAAAPAVGVPHLRSSRRVDLPIFAPPAPGSLARGRRS